MVGNCSCCWGTGKSSDAGASIQTSLWEHVHCKHIQFIGPTLPLTLAHSPVLKASWSTILAQWGAGAGDNDELLLVGKELSLWCHVHWELVPLIMNEGKSMGMYNKADWKTVRQAHAIPAWYREHLPFSETFWLHLRKFQWEGGSAHNLQELESLSLVDRSSEVWVPVARFVLGWKKVMNMACAGQGC